MEHAADRVVEALERLLQIEEECSRDLAASRESAKRMGDNFEMRLHGGIDETSDRPPPLEFIPSRSSNESIAKSASRSRDRELAFQDAQQALMELYADDATRPRAQHVFDLLRDFRLLDRAAIDPLDTVEPPLFEAPTKGGLNRLEGVSEFHRRMRAYVDSVQAHADEIIAKQAALLRQAQDAARRLR